MEGMKLMLKSYFGCTQIFSSIFWLLFLGWQSVAFCNENEQLQIGNCKVSSQGDFEKRDGKPWFLASENDLTYVPQKSFRCAFNLSLGQYQCTGAVIYSCPTTAMGTPMQFILFAGENQRVFPVQENIKGIGLSIKASYANFLNGKFPILRTVGGASSEAYSYFTDLFFPYKIANNVHHRIRKWHQLNHFTTYAEEKHFLEKSVADDIRKRARLSLNAVIEDLENIILNNDLSSNQLNDVLSSMLDWIWEDQLKEFGAQVVSLLKDKYSYLYTTQIKEMLETL